MKTQETLNKEIDRVMKNAGATSTVIMSVVEVEIVTTVRNRKECEAIYKAELELMNKFPTVHFNFHCYF